MNHASIEMDMQMPEFTALISCLGPIGRPALAPMLLAAASQEGRTPEEQFAHDLGLLIGWAIGLALVWFFIRPLMRGIFSNLPPRVLGAVVLVLGFGGMSLNRTMMANLGRYSLSLVMFASLFLGMGIALLVHGSELRDKPHLRPLALAYLGIGLVMGGLELRRFGFFEQMADVIGLFR
jgi:xanthine/uracil permease